MNADIPTTTPNNNDSNKIRYVYLIFMCLFICILIIETYVFYTVTRYKSAIQIIFRIEKPTTPNVEIDEPVTFECM